MSELPNPVNFEAATSTVREEDITELVACGPDPEVHVAAIKEFVDAGFGEVCVVQVGDDHEGFFRFWEDELRPAPRLTASPPAGPGGHRGWFSRPAGPVPFI
ncbi:hypothetical protein BH23ACT7_BH23ACT7_20430 [soil metagenome]